MKDKFGLLGEKLAHSFSPQIHRKLASYPYSLYEVEKDCLSDWVNNNGLKGYNVTIPYKQEIMKYCAELSACAEKIGAVNTVIKREDGKLYGDNTDYYGFSYMLSLLDISLKGKKAVVLGSGGASKTAQTVLSEQGAEVVTVSRKGENNYGNIAKHRDASLVVNATPVGMYPHNGESPVDLSLFTSLEGVLDVIYNPARTALLLQAEKLGVKYQNGLSMLVAQAKRACELFEGREIDNREIERIRREIALETENIILIGMPGCGKSTVGKIISKKLSRAFADCDDAVFAHCGKSPSEIISSEGEEAFRLIETDVLKNIAKQSGRVIATGGGVVTRSENCDILRQNGRLIFIERDLLLLATDDRPLSKNLQTLYSKRLPMYLSFADKKADGNGSAEDVSERVIEAFKEVTE
ncbi:MAG: shikimate kinase [Ruminococcus sp.]